MCLLFSVVVFVMLVYLLIRLEGASATHLWFPVLKMVVMLAAIIQSVLLLTATYSRVAFLTALLLVGLLVLILRPDYVQHSPPIFLLTLLALVAFPIVDFTSKTDAMVVLAFSFLLLSSVVEYGFAAWFFIHKTADVRLTQVSVMVETQVFKLVAIALYALALLAWYLGWEDVGMAALVAFVMHVSFLVWACCLGRGQVFHPISMETLSREILKNFGVEILLGMENDSCGQGIYQRLCYYFEKEKPFLDPDLTVGEVSRALFTNKVYLGKAIKHYAHLNFPRFVNRYRVRHAQTLFKANHNLKVTQLFMMSGFKTKATFDVAFHFETGESPKEWCDFVRSKGK